MIVGVLAWLLAIRIRSGQVVVWPRRNCMGAVAVVRSGLRRCFHRTSPGHSALLGKGWGGLFVVCWCVDVGAGRAYSTDPDFHQDGKFLGHNESLRRLLVR
jgi:hypothetical protein